MAIEALEPRQMLAVYTVDSPVDYHVNDHTNLREAIAPAGNGDTIRFDSSLIGSGSATIELSSALTLSHDITIEGLGKDDLVIDAQGNDRVFMVNGGVTATISDLTVTGGDSDYGGGIFNSGNLTLNSVHVTANSSSAHGGGIFDNGTLVLHSSLVDGNHADAAAGGGIFVNSTAYARIIDSTIDSNYATSGAGISVIWERARN
jgi:hypothetical protein